MGFRTRNPADHILDIEIKVLTPFLGADQVVPRYQSAGAAGLDLVSARRGTVKIEPGEIEKIGTGIAVHIGEPGVAAFVFPRSGRATKAGLVLANTVGVIDSDYQGEIICAVRNQGSRTLVINEGERIAQLVFMPVVIANLIEVESFGETTERGTGGYGSTGTGGPGRGEGVAPEEQLIAAFIALEGGH